VCAADALTLALLRLIDDRTPVGGNQGAGRFQVVYLEAEAHLLPGRQTAMQGDRDVAGQRELCPLVGPERRLQSEDTLVEVCYRSHLGHRDHEVRPGHFHRSMVRPGPRIGPIWATSRQ